MVYQIQLRQELIAIDKSDNINSLLDMSDMKHKMMSKSVVTLLSKICFLQVNQSAKDPSHLK